MDVLISIMYIIVSSKLTSDSFLAYSKSSQFLSNPVASATNKILESKSIFLFPRVWFSTACTISCENLNTFLHIIAPTFACHNAKFSNSILSSSTLFSFKICVQVSLSISFATSCANPTIAAFCSSSPYIFASSTHLCITAKECLYLFSDNFDFTISSISLNSIFPPCYFYA